MSLLWVLLCGLYHCPETIWSVPHSWNTSQSLSPTPTLFSPFPALKSPFFFLPLPSPSEPSSIPTSAETLPGGSVPFLHPPPQTPLKLLVSWRSLSRLSSFLVSVTPSHRHVFFPQTNCRLPSEGEDHTPYNRSERNKLSIKRSTGRHTKELNTITSLVLCLSIRTPTSQLLVAPLFSEEGKADVLKILLVINWPGLPLHP